ncbi:proline racemase family protein [Streptomyces sp. NPDC002851]
MVNLPNMVSVVDYHTAGEPFRIVIGGVAAPRGKTILDKRDDAMARLDDVRVLLTHEPRGHADMYGCYLTEPDDEGADLGLIFFHREGFSTACGHGSIAAAMWAYETGYVAPRGGDTIVLDVPSGRVTCRVRDEGDHPTVSFTNIPSYAHEQDVEVTTSAGSVRADLAYGGAFYAMVDVRTLGLEVTPSDLRTLIGLAAEIKTELTGARTLSDPDDARINGLYGVIFYDRIAADSGSVEERNVTVFADGQVDRSPCGSGTSARIAALAARGDLVPGGELTNHSIVDTTFTGRIAGTVTLHGRPAVIPEVEGMAFRTAQSTLVLDPHDELGTGFLLP